MSASTNALLWFGVAIEGSPDDGDEIPERIHAITYGDEDDDENDLYGDGREWMAEHGITGIEFIEHCSGDYPMYGIAATGTVLTAHRGYPEQVNGLTVPDDLTPLIATIRALGIDQDSCTIGWHLASWWNS
jgi:hypothetical protein